MLVFDVRYGWPVSKARWQFSGLFGRDYFWKWLWNIDTFVLDGFGDFGVVSLFDGYFAHARGSLARHWLLWFFKLGTTRLFASITDWITYGKTTRYFTTYRLFLRWTYATGYYFDTLSTNFGHAFPMQREVDVHHWLLLRCFGYQLWPGFSHATLVLARLVNSCIPTTT